MDELHKHNAEQKKFQSSETELNYLGICTLIWYKYKGKQRVISMQVGVAISFDGGRNGASEEMQYFYFFIRLYDIYLNLLN